MRLETFFEKFDLLAETPNGVAKLRELVLYFAVRGKLLPRLKSDDVVEKSFPLMANVALKKCDLFPPHWLAVSLGDCGEWRGGGTPSKSRPDFWRGKIPWVSPKDMKSFQISDAQDHISEEALESCSVRAIPERSLLMVVRGMILARAFPVAVALRQVTINQDMKALTPTYSELTPFLLIALRENERRALGLIERSTHGTCKLETASLQSIPIPIPPLAEQKRIVAKVDELMGLCDQLEARQRERKEQHAALARAALARFTEDPTPANLEYLFHPSFDISPGDLRKTILTLAVRGKLVMSDNRSFDSSSSKSISRDCDELTSLPKHWRCLQLREIAAEIVDCPHSTPKWTENGKICIRTNQFRPGYLSLDQSRFVSEKTYQERIQRIRPQQDDVLYSREGGILGVACRIPPNVDLCLGQRMMLIRSGTLMSPQYLELVLNSPLITEIAFRKTTGGAAPRVNVATVRAYPIPLPPLAEQKRIVAKVEQLMALVDQLEAQQAAARTAAEKLMEAAVHELTHL